MRSFFLERRPAREVAERFGYSLSTVYNMTRDFRQLDDPAALFFRNPVPRGRPAVRHAPRLRQRIVALRKRNLSVPDIRAWLDAEEPRSPSERVIENVLKDEGFQRLPQRTRAERFASAPPTVGAPASVLLAPDRAESFQCESAAGVLCLLPWVRRYGVDRAIAVRASSPASTSCPRPLGSPPIPIA